MYVKNKFQSHYVQLYWLLNLIFDSVFILFTLSKIYCLTKIFGTPSIYVSLFEKNCFITCIQLYWLLNLIFDFVFILFTLIKIYCLTKIFGTPSIYVSLFEKNCFIACYKIQLINSYFPFYSF